MFERFTKDAHDAVTTAEVEARRRGDGPIGTEHLILGIVASWALESLRLRPDALRRELDRLDAEALDSMRIDPSLAELRPPETRSAEIKGRHLPFPEAAKDTLKRALQHAIGLKHRHIGPEHIALALTSPPATDRVVRALHGLGLDPVELHASLSSILRPAS